MKKGGAQHNEFALIAYEANVGQEIATALEIQRADILCGIATRIAREGIHVARPIHREHESRE